MESHDDFDDWKDAVGRLAVAFGDLLSTAAVDKDHVFLRRI